NYLVVNIKTGINNINEDDGLTIYPNPNNGDFTIKGDILPGNVAIEIVNAIGQRVYYWQAATASTVLEHKVHLNVASGIYLVKVTTGEGTKLMRLELVK